MSFWGHIGELRGHLIRSIIAVVIGAIIVGFNIKWFFDGVFIAPTQTDFVTYGLLNDMTDWMYGERPFSLPDTFEIQQKKLMEQFNTMLYVSIFGGILLTFPYMIWELWRFIKPALMPQERKNSAFAINFVWILFIIGTFIGYFLILPLAINFGLVFNISDNITQLFDLTDYTSLFMQVVFGMGIIFLFPVIVYFLTQIGILTPEFLKKYRKHSIIVILVLAAIITPADIFSMFAAALPLLILYEFSVLMSNRVHKRLLKEEARSRRTD